MRIASLLVLVGCAVGQGGSPQLSSIEDQIAIVGEELRIDLDGTDPEGDQLTYRYTLPSSLGKLDGRASLNVAPSGVGVFRWTPLAEDLGSHAIDFIVSDGVFETVTTINIDVVATRTAPVFRSPIGTGSTLDLTVQQCIELDIVIEDYDSIDVAITQEAPAIAGAQLAHGGAMDATWKWCPTPAQRAESRHTLVLGADDGVTKTTKSYLVILREPPVVTTCTDDSHEPDDKAPSARTTTYPTFASTANVACTGDDDWYAVPLFAGELLSVDLTFQQTNASQDLDIHLYNGTTHLTPCDVASPQTCALGNGQSGDSNERMSYTVPATCTSECMHYVVVRGFDGASSPYAITIAIQ